MSEDSKPIRGKPNTEGPWCWQSKEVLRKIREAFDLTHDVGSALAVYLGLTEIASDEKTSEFKTTHAHIAALSGFRISTVQNHLKVFEELNLIQIDTPRLRGPCTYRLLPFGNGYRTFGNTSIHQPLPAVEEVLQKAASQNSGFLEPLEDAQRKKNGGRSSPHQDAAPASSKGKEFPSELLAKLKIVQAELKEIADRDAINEYRDSNGRLTERAKEHRKRLRVKEQELKAKLDLPQMDDYNPEPSAGPPLRNMI